MHLKLPDATESGQSFNVIRVSTTYLISTILLNTTTMDQTVCKFHCYNSLYNLNIFVILFTFFSYPIGQLLIMFTHMLTHLFPSDSIPLTYILTLNNHIPLLYKYSPKPCTYPQLVPIQVDFLETCAVRHQSCTLCHKFSESL